MVGVELSPLRLLLVGWFVAGLLPRPAWRCHQGCIITQLPWAHIQTGRESCQGCEPVFLLEEKVSRYSTWYEPCQAGVTSSGVHGCLSTGFSSTKSTHSQSFPLPACTSKAQNRPASPVTGAAMQLCCGPWMPVSLVTSDAVLRSRSQRGGTSDARLGSETRSQHKCT